MISNTDSIGIADLDITPFGLPNCVPGEIRFEDPRDIVRLVVHLKSEADDKLKVFYQRGVWPNRKLERDYRGTDNALRFGWGAIDDWFNTPFVEASTEARPLGNGSFEVTFKPITAELPDLADYDVTFRRTLGLKVEADVEIVGCEVYTVWQPSVTEIEIRLDCGKNTPGSTIAVSGYNAEIESPKDIVDTRKFRVRARHLLTTMEYAFDDGHVSFDLEHDKFTISLLSLAKQGPIWYEEEGIYIRNVDDPTTFEDYLTRIDGAKTRNEAVAEGGDPGLGGALLGQPRAHPTAQSIGCKNARQRFWVDYNGDIVLTRQNVHWSPGKDTLRYKAEGDARVFFGLEYWRSMGRFTDPSPIVVQNNHFADGGLVLEQKALAAPLQKKTSDPLVGDDSIVALVRFRFKNEGLVPVTAEMPLDFSSKSNRSHNRPGWTHWHSQGDDYLVPTSERAKVSVSKDPAAPSLTLASSKFEDTDFLRFAIDTPMDIVETERGLVIRKELEPGESVEALVKIPFIALEHEEELRALDTLAFDPSYADVRAFWTEEAAKGATIRTPEARLNDLYNAHVAHIMGADYSMPDEPYLINTSVGSSTYGNFTNESVMILDEFEGRGLHEEVRRRLSVWLRYQSTVALKGSFTDHDGVFFGAGGFESGDTYSQHHGWALMWMGEHYLYTRDDKWLFENSDQMIRGAEWIIRQRANTMKELPHSRGWEYGFMPAASLEDVADYFYWLTTNTMSWKGMDSVAAAFEAAGHSEAGRLRKESDAFKADLTRGWETMRQHSPVVRLRNGRWVPYYTSRLYRRGRDVGWIRENLEGSIYLLISGFFDPKSRQGQWIVDDFQDNRYISDRYGYPVWDAENQWYDFGGLSCQPNLLAGLMPHLDRDEPEIYLWMFFNCWAACYREETNVMVEHPAPILGHSNSAFVKTSDQANAMKWLRNIFVYGPNEGLYIGRAIPRKWFKIGKPIGAQRVVTRFGKVGAEYTAFPGGIRLDVDLDLHHSPNEIVARFRHPEALPIKSVTVNGNPHTGFVADKGDVILSGLLGKIIVEAEF